MDYEYGRLTLSLDLTKESQRKAYQFLKHYSDSRKLSQFVSSVVNRYMASNGYLDASQVKDEDWDILAKGDGKLNDSLTYEQLREIVHGMVLEAQGTSVSHMVKEEPKEVEMPSLADDEDNDDGGFSGNVLDGLNAFGL